MKIYSGLASKGIQPKENQQTNLGNGMSNLVVDKTPIQVLISILPSILATANTGLWMARFLKKGWNYRSVSGYLPTWRWWVEHSEDSTPLKGRYDFDQAYNGGNSSSL